jgi:hypothetical protein
MGLKKRNEVKGNGNEKRKFSEEKKLDRKR